jgi:glycosyltransferase involved in cell wall biosynthesis
MLRIALFAPLRPVRTALADHIEGILPLLARHLDITVVTKGDYTPTHAMFQKKAASSMPYIGYREFQRNPQDYDLIIYQMGDEPEIHGYMLEALAEHPGLVLLNDLVMHHAIAGITLNRGRPEQYMQEMRYSYGQLGERIAKRLMAGGRDDLMWQFPLVERILDQSLAVAGFNGYMCEQIRTLRPDLPQRLIPYPFYLPEGVSEAFDASELRHSLDLEDRLVVASFGFFIPDKRLRLVMRAFKRVLDKHPQAFYLLVGGSSPYYDLGAELRLEGLDQDMRLTGWQDPVEFTEFMHATDIAVHLRWPHIGGTPYTPIRLLGLGVPTIISDIEPLAEIPEDAVLRVPPNHPDEEELLAQAIDELLSDPRRASKMAAAGRRYIQENHDLEHVAQEYLAYIRWVVENRERLEEQVQERRRRAEEPEPRPGYARTIGVLGEALAALGLSSDDERWLKPFAKAVDELLGPEEPAGC